MNIIRAGVLLIAYMFIVLAFYIFLSAPFDEVVTGFEDINGSASDTYVDYHGGMIRTVFDISFALAGIIPIAFFASWAFSREPDRPGGGI